jgi:hypothetical protein
MIIYLYIYLAARKLKCDGERPICGNCRKRTQNTDESGSPPPAGSGKARSRSPCAFDAFPRRRGPAKHKLLRLDADADADAEPSWSQFRVVPRTRARVAAEAKVLAPSFVVGAGVGGIGGGGGGGTIASVHESEGSSAGGSGGVHASAASILFGGVRTQHEEAAAATAAASPYMSTRGSTPAPEGVDTSADEEDTDRVEGPQPPKDGGEEKNEQVEEEQNEENKNPEKDEERHRKHTKEEVKPKKGRPPTKGRSSPREEKKEDEGKLERDEEKAAMFEEGTPESPSSLSLQVSGRHR